MNKEAIKHSVLKLNLSEQEKIDVDHALTIMEKVSPAELIFANKVLQELKIKTICAEHGDDHQMEYWNYEQCKRYAELDEKINATH